MSDRGKTETKTIIEYFDENPSVDNTAIFERFWAILSSIRERLAERFSFTRHASCDGLEFYQTDDGAFEGSLNAYAGSDVEWLVHSWIGNRKNSILDMNINVWLGPQIDVPHLVIVFGTIPKLFHYSDFIARRDLMANLDDVQRYYEPASPAYLELRGDPRFEWSVSHGTYMRSILSPIASSYTAERSEANIDAMQAYVEQLFSRWLRLVDDAAPVPESERPALAARDHLLRKTIYTNDPMNALARRFLGDALTERLVETRYGKQQLEAAAKAGAR
jgi:Red chlorophyll catabolite reductase (RCC reductase)